MNCLRFTIFCLTVALLLPCAVTWAAQPIPVVATFSILGDLTAQLGGDKVAVTVLVGPDEDAHVYEPTPADAVAIAKARLVIQNGLHFEGWFPRLINGAGYQGKVVTASDGVEVLRVQGEIDPHAWQSLRNIRQYAENISAALQTIKPQSKLEFEKRLQQFLAETEALERKSRSQLYALPLDRRKVVTSHDAFAYLAVELDLIFLAPVGLSTEEEASGAALAALIRQIRKDQIRALFLDNISDPRVLQQIARETGVVIGGHLYSDALSHAGGPAATYLQMMEHNLNALIGALSSSSNTTEGVP